MLQSAFHFIKEVPLSGAEFVQQVDANSIDKWTDQTAQHSIEEHSKKTFAFRPDAVRLMNQLRFTFLDEHNPQVVFGKEGYYFEEGYRNSVCGADFIGDEQIQLKIDSLDHFRDYLLSRGKKLVIMIAPNKWRTHRNKVDWNCKGSKTNYEAFIDQLNHRGYSVCDEIDMFKYETKQNPPYPLHSKQGTHWSIFGAAVSADHLWMTFAQEGISLPKFKVVREELDSIPRNTDRDLHDLLNIMLPPEKEMLAYPEFEFSQGYKPRVTVIGDSYYHSYFYLGLHQGLFSMDSKFLYYNKSVFNSERSELSDDIRKNEIDASDAVLLVMSEPSLSKFGFGFFKLYQDQY